MLVFVYGTLKQGYWNNHLLAGSRFLGEAETEEKFALLDLGAFPGLVPGKRAIRGELYEVNDVTLARLDQLEGEGVLYKRTPITAYVEAVKYPCETYVLINRAWGDRAINSCSWEGNHGSAKQNRR